MKCNVFSFPYKICDERLRDVWMVLSGWIILLGLLSQFFPLFSNLYSTLGMHVLCLNLHGKCLHIWLLAGLLATRVISWSNGEKFLICLHGDMLSKDCGPQGGLLGRSLHVPKTFMHRPLSLNCYHKSICPLGRASAVITWYEFSKTHFRRRVLGSYTHLPWC